MFKSFFKARKLLVSDTDGSLFLRMFALLILIVGGMSLIDRHWVLSEASTNTSHEEIFASPTVPSTPTPVVIQKSLSSPKTQAEEWGIAKQVDEHTWSMKVGKDERMATSQEILEALNAYRQRHGKGTLSWDEKLGEYAQSRANGFSAKGTIDGHVGFNNFVQNEDGFSKLGFNALGENSSIGYRLLGVHLIEWVYAGDPPHNENQLSSEWSHVGIGVAGSASELVFGGGKR